MKRLLITGLIVAGLLMSAQVVVAEPEYEEQEYMDDELTVDSRLKLPVAKDLRELGRSSSKKVVPILLLFAEEDCNYCKRLEGDVLGPLRLSGVDPHQVIVRKVMLESYETIRDFSGKTRGAESYGMEKGVSVVPTVALVDENGLDLVPKIVGYQASGLYESYLDEAIKVSTLLLKQRPR